MDIETVKQKRASIRGSFTKAANRLETLFQDRSADFTDVEIALEQLQDKAKQLRDSDDIILRLMQEKGCTQKDYDTEYNAAEEYHDKFISVKTKARKILSKVCTSSNSVEISSAHVVQIVQHKLPKIELRKFNGDPREWLNFWSQFEKIHQDQTIDDRDKFQYLIQSTEPNSKPREIVESFPATATNYAKAVDYLQQRFGKESVLIQVYIRGLLQLVTDDKKKMDLSSLYDKLQTQLGALESLGLTKDKYADFLFPLVESALPPDLIKIWARNRSLGADDKGKTDLDSLTEFLKNEVQSDQQLKLVRDTFVFDKVNKRSYVRNSEHNSSTPTASELLTTNKSYVHNVKKFDLCIFCEKPHVSESCNEASAMTLDLRKNIVKKKNACFVCLKKGHRSNQCKSKHRCLICKNRHFVVLCPDLPLKTDDLTVEEKDGNKIKTSTLNNYTQLSDVLLQTLIVKLRNGNRELLVRAIFDTGSMKSYVSKDIAEFMNFKVLNEVTLKQSLFGGVETEESVHKNYLVEISSVDDKYKCKFEALSQQQICSEIKQIPSGPWLNECKIHGIKVTDLERNSLKVSNEIKLLIGADIAGKLFTRTIISLKSGPIAIRTLLGWTLMGKIGTRPTENESSVLITPLFAKNQCISDLWKLDVLGISESLHNKNSAELEEDTNEYFNETLRVDSDGRYEVALPWVLDNSLLPDNRKLAEKSLQSTKRKLISSGMIEDYNDVLNTWLSLGIIEVASDAKQEGVHYLPHRPVVKEESTTKIRPFFNASARTGKVPSLNDCLATGPNLIEIIAFVLNRFRKNYVGITSDIEKAFLQIAVRVKDRDFLSFIWCGDDGEGTKIYRHRRVVFGITSSPFLLAATLQYHLSRVPENLRETAEILAKSFYMDNCVTSLNNVEEADQFILESQMIMSSGHFNLRGWQSNVSTTVTEEIFPQEKNVSVLGFVWDTDKDTLSCKVDQGMLLIQRD